jgi:hypothetical protein
VEWHIVTLTMAYNLPEIHPENITPAMHPMPGPKKANPTTPCEKLYTSMNRGENVMNMSEKMPDVLRIVRATDI